MQTLTEELLATYREVMGKLMSLPEHIAIVQYNLGEKRRAIAEKKEEVNLREAQMSLTVDGKNAEERKAKLAVSMRSDPTVQKLQLAINGMQVEADNLSIEAEMLIKEFGAASSQAKLHAALLQYLGESNAPSTPVDSLGDIIYPDVKQRNVQYLSAQDIADLGL